MKSWRRNLVIAILLVGLGFAGYFAFMSWTGQNEVLAISAELDRTEPGWRFEDWVKRIGNVSDEENSLHVVQALSAKIPRTFTHDPTDPNYKPWEWTACPTPNRLFDPHWIDAMRQHLGDFPERAELLKRLAERPNGRHFYPIAANPMTILLPHFDAMYTTNLLLELEIFEGAGQKPADEIVSYHHAMLNCSRIFLDEPLMISQMMRNAKLSNTAKMLQYVLGVSKLPAAALEEIQKRWTEEEAYPAHRIGVKGNRALQDLFYRHLAAGKISYAEIGQMPGMMGAKTRASFLPVPALGFYLSSTHHASHAFVLKADNRRLAALDAPIFEQRKILEAIEKEGEKAPPLASTHNNLRSANLDTFLLSSAKQRAVVSALAVERYRLRHGKYPETLDAVVPEFLPKLYDDPFSVQPLSYRKTADGAVVYSKGKDGEKSGDFHDRREQKEADPDDQDRALEFRLWTPDHRRLPPLERKKETEP